MTRFLRFFFHHLYHHLAWSYDLVAFLVSGGKWLAWGRAALPHLKGKRVLELGFGPGHLQSALHQNGFQAMGLDASPQMVARAAALLRRNGQSLRLIRGYAQNIPLAAESVESVLATFPSDYIAAPKTLAEIRRVLGPGGRLVVVLAAAPGGTRPWDAIARLVFWVTHQTPDENVGVEFLTLLQQAGFRAERICTGVDESVVWVFVAKKPGE